MSKAGVCGHYETDWKVLENGNLVFTANETARAEMAESSAEGRSWDDLWSDFLSPFVDASELHHVAPEDIAALTDAPIITDDFTIDDDGTRKVLGRVWWYPNYMITDPLEVLRDTGEVEFTLAADAEPEEGEEADGE